MDYRQIAEDIVKNNFNLPIDGYTIDERFKIKEAVYKCLRYDHVKEAALETLNDSYEILVNTYSNDEIDGLADIVAEEWVYNENVKADLSDYENICQLIDDNYKDALEEQEYER